MEENHAQVLLIFQAPGVEEWEKGKPVVSTKIGSVGVRLEAAFHRANRTRQNYNITNTVQCFPGKKIQDGVSKPRDLAPPAAVRGYCAEWLRLDIEARKYNRIVVFGAHARKAVQMLGFATDSRFHFLRHPAGGLKNIDLDRALGSLTTPF
jgi:uracil-DNA glycosylase family 4